MDKKLKKYRKLVKTFYPNAEIIKAKRFLHGWINENYLIQIKNPTKSFVLRIYAIHGKPSLENIFLKKLNKAGVPAPRILFYDDTQKFISKSYALMSLIPGNNLEYGLKKLNKNQLKSLSFEVGKTLRKIHSITFKNFGRVRKGIGCSIYQRVDNANWRVFCKKWFDYELKNIKKNHTLDKKILNDLKKFFKSNLKKIPSNVKPVFIHNDFNLDNMNFVVNKNKIKLSGIFDIEHSFAGHSEIDFVKLSLWTFTKKGFSKEDFLRGYGKMSAGFEERLEIYKVLIIISMIVWAKRAKPKFYKYLIKIVDSIIK